MIHHFVLDRPYRYGDFICHVYPGFDPYIEWYRCDADGYVELSDAQDWLDNKGYQLPLSDEEYLEFSLVFG